MLTPRSRTVASEIALIYIEFCLIFIGFWNSSFFLPIAIILMY